MIDCGRIASHGPLADRVLRAHRRNASAIRDVLDYRAGDGFEFAGAIRE